MADAEWAFRELFINAVRQPNGRRWTDPRLALDGVFWIARTSAPWRDLPAKFGKWSSVYRQFRRWTIAGLWELILEALNDGGAAPREVQMVDSTTAQAHQHAAGSEKGLRKKLLGARGAGFRRRPICGPMDGTCL
ncbi:transposase [Palleronia aestuarii]|uniref:Transposase n=1 Tax=Palleronia aestuarii TaxID=568105 RepID=A0A2W7NGG9_9RHOB|nr:transposase [Palleronia aestuarii]